MGKQELALIYRNENTKVFIHLQRRIGDEIGNGVNSAYNISLVIGITQD
jgi:hypothetical protein